MKAFTIFLTSFVIASFSLGCAVGTLPSYLSDRPIPEWSVEDHWEAVRLYEEETRRLETKVAHLEKRISSFKKKPYRATRATLQNRQKRVRRLQRQMEAKRSSLLSLREQLAWHQTQAERLNTLQPSEGIGKFNGSQKHRKASGSGVATQDGYARPSEQKNEEEMGSRACGSSERRENVRFHTTWAER